MRISTKVASTIITTVRFPACGYCCSRECLDVVPACVGGVMGGAATVRLEKAIRNKKKACTKRKGPAQEGKRLGGP
jgi:hypothetical protein